MMRRYMLVAALLVGGPARAGCTLEKMAELPVTMRGMQPTVPIRINGQPLRFMADSGAFYSLITPGTARQLALRLTEAPRGLTLIGVGGRVRTDVATVDRLSLGNADLRRIDFLVAGSEVGGGNGGVIGQNVLGLADADYDLAGGMIRLLRPKGCEKASLAYWAQGKPVQIVPIENTGRYNLHVMAPVYVNGVKLRAMFDTGASRSMIAREAAARLGVKPGDPGVEEAGYDSGLGRRQVRSWIAPFKSFRLGDEEVRATRIRIADVPAEEFDMLVGADFFLAHHIYVSNAQHRLYVTYGGGPVFQLGRAAVTTDAEATAAADDTPSDAEAYSRRGAARLARRDTDGAAADFDRAIELAPAEPRYLVQRAEARLDARAPLRAKADLDAALKLQPDNVDALVTRAGMYLRDRDFAAAHADAVAAATAAPREADIRLHIATLLEVAHAPAEAIAQYDIWLDAHRVDSKRPTAMNGRCWARALAGTDLTRALDDCNAALRERPGTATYLDSRALVRLRLGDTVRAIADYDAALAGAPKQAWSLYGRGLARLRSGDAAGGRADIAAALVLQPRLTEDARRYGIVPADGAPR